jgi:hypothetical protein
MKPFKNKQAQSVLELAIFGSILIMLIGVLLSYGLRYNNEQKTMMSTFRKALQKSAEKDPATGEEILGGQGSYTLIQDKHIPNPANPFGVGQVTPSVSNASVIRSYRLHESPNTLKALPQTTIEIQGQEGAFKQDFKTAAFRLEPVREIYTTPAPTSEENAEIQYTSLDRYKEVYGSTNIWVDERTRTCFDDPPPDPNDPSQQCQNSSVTIRIMDSCEGEIINYDGCKRQCRMIVDKQSCVTECKRGKSNPGEDTECEKICRNPIGIPWYCKDAEPTGTGGSYRFPHLDDIFNFAIASNKPKSMGVQPDYTQHTVIDKDKTSLNKRESPGAITTTDTLAWKDTTNRTIIWNDNIDKTTKYEKATDPAKGEVIGLAIQQKKIIGDEAATEVGEAFTQTCTNGVCPERKAQ